MATWREKGRLKPKDVWQGFQQVSHAGQDKNVHVPRASMIESIHAGEDKNVHVPSASRNNSPTGPRTCSRLLSANVSIFEKNP